MAARASRLMSALTAGGVLAGSLLLGSASADAAPRPPGGGTVAASCGQTVTAYPGDRVKVTPAVGLPFVQNVTAGMGPVAMTVSGLLCSVNVKVLVPVAQQLTAVAPPLGQVTTKVTEGVGEVLTPKSQSAPSAALVPAPRAAAPMVPLAPTRAPVSTLPSGGSLSTLPSGQPAADAPLFAPAFSNELPSSFLSSGAPAAVAAPTTAGAGSLFGSAFPGLNTGAPAYLGYDPASAVTTASQVQALPVDGFSDGVGIPAILAVLALSGAAAFAVRRMVLGKSLIPAALTVGPAAGAVAAAPLAAPASAPVEAPAETDVERTALVGAPITDAAEVTSVTPAVPALDPAEETAVAPALTDAEVTSVTPAVPALDPAEVTAVTPAVTDEAEDVPAETPAEVTGVIDAPVDAPADSESTGVLASAAN